MDNLSLIPYATYNCVPTFKDSDVMGFFDRMVRDGTVETVFYDVASMTREDFLEMMRQPGRHLYATFDGKVLVGVVWLDRFDLVSAHTHFCVFREGWGKSAEIARESMRKLLFLKNRRGEYVFGVLFGFAPEWNKRAEEMLVRAGGEKIGTVPGKTYRAADGKIYPAAMLCFTREYTFPNEGGDQQ